MKQCVKAYSNIYYAQEEINKMIEKGWKIKDIAMTNGHEYNGVSRNPSIITEKVLVLFEKNDETFKANDTTIKGLDI